MPPICCFTEYVGETNDGTAWGGALKRMGIVEDRGDCRALDNYKISQSDQIVRLSLDKYSSQMAYRRAMISLKWLVFFDFQL